MASKQWPSGGYAGTATTLINAVMSTDMSGSYIKAGSNYSASQITNPSYFAPGVLPGLRLVVPGDNSYTLLNAALQGRSNGLVPAWCTGGLCNGPASNGGTDDMRYQYDSHRIPWRIGLDYCWNGTADAKTYLDKISRILLGQGFDRCRPRLRHLQLTRHGDEQRRGQLRLGHRYGRLRRDGEHADSTFMNDGYQLVLDLLNRGEDRRSAARRR